MHHGLRYDPREHLLVPFGTEEDLERAVEGCRHGQVRSERRKERKRAAAAAASVSVSQGNEPSEIKEASGESLAVATTEADEPEFSGAAEVEVATGDSPASPPPKPPARSLDYKLEDISDAEDGPVDPYAVSFLRARTVADLVVRGRVTPLPSQGDAPPPKSFLPPQCFAPAIRVMDPYYWPNESDWEYTAPPAANLRYATPVSALSTPVVTPAIIRPRVLLPPLVPPRWGHVKHEESRRTDSWHVRTATANATSMRGNPPITDAEPVRKLRRPPGGPQNLRDLGISTVAFTSTTDRPTDAFCACTEVVEWLSAIPHLISITVGQPGSSLSRISASNVVPSDPRDQSRSRGGVVDLELPRFALRRSGRSFPRAIECGELEGSPKSRKLQTDGQVTEVETPTRTRGIDIETQVTMGTCVEGIALPPGVSPADCAELCCQRGASPRQLIDCLQFRHRFRLGRPFSSRERRDLEMLFNFVAKILHRTSLQVV